MPWKRLEDIFAGSLEDALKTSWRRLQNVLKMSWRHLEDVLKTYGQEKYIGLDQDVLKTSSEDVFWRRRAKANIFVLIKTSWRCLQDVFWRRKRKTSSRRLQEVFIKTNVCWYYFWWNRIFNEQITLGSEAIILDERRIQIPAKHLQWSVLQK